MTRQTSIQLTQATERQIEALKAEGFGSFTDIVRIAVDRMYREEAENTLNMVTATHTYVTEDKLDEAGLPFTVTFSDKSGPFVVGPYIDEAFSDRDAAIAHAQAILGMTFDWEALTQSTLYQGMVIVWASAENERQLQKK